MQTETSRTLIEEMGGAHQVATDSERRRQKRAETPRHADFKEICAIDARVLAIFRSIPRVMAAGKNPWWQWSLIKRKFSAVVGWDGANDQLVNDYDVVFRTMLAEAERCSPEPWV